MRKKILFPLLIGLILLAATILGQQPSYSQTLSCKEVTTNQMSVMRKAWEQNLTSITSQEIPASEMVDDAFESARTYRCWLEYLCRAVYYSGNANPAESASIGLAEGHIGRVPGCVPPEDVEIPGTAIEYIPECKTTGNNISSEESLNNLNANFRACVLELEREFGNELADESDKDQLTRLQDEGVVYIKLEKELKTVNAVQRARALEEKLLGIVNRMRVMETYAQTLKTLFLKLNALLPCYAGKCT
ncbi:MAG: hypothetical protein V1760_03320 [Candidatus Peregrinibacteria bacterium]